ncbi:Adenylate cyclase [Minicystis rosea]|nr:Adenylate cyclase [Minicystis rosea]
MKLSIRLKAVLLISVMTLGPVGLTAALLLDVNRRPVLDTEEQLQSAVVNEVSFEPARVIHEIENDAVAVAAVFSRAAEGAIRDEDAIESVRALIGSRETIDAVRFEVPSANVSTVIRWKTSSADVPSSTPELRALADQHGQALSSAGVVVVRIKAPSGKQGSAPPPGYITVRADLARIGASLEDIAQRRFVGNVSLLVVTHDRRVVASYGVPGVAPGANVESFPVWQMLPGGTVPNKAFSVNGRYVDHDTPMVGALQVLPDSGWIVASFRPQSIAYKALTDMRQRGLVVAAAAALLAVLVGLFAGRTVTAPILRVVEQVRLIAKRRWREISFDSARGDEIGELTQSLGEMAHDLEQGEVEAKLRGDLSRFMSKQLVDAIVKGEHSLSLGGKRTAVSVVFADVVGFTPLAEARDAEQIVGLLNELFSVLTEIVFRHGGTVDKFIGDCIMAVWGAPVAQPDHARLALAAAEDMMRFLETANEEWKAKYDIEIRLGIGVNSGEAIVGNVGSQKRMEYTVIGDVVNVAARLEAIAQPNQVLVAEATRDLVGDAFALHKLGDRRLTGRKTETTVYALDLD